MARKPTHAYGEPRACTRCGQVFPNTDVYFYPVKANQPTPLRSQCRPCYTTTVSEKWAKRRDAGKTARNPVAEPAPKAVDVGRNPVQLLDGKKFFYRTPQHARLAILAVIRRAERNTPEIAQKGVLEQFDDVA